MLARILLSWLTLFYFIFLLLLLASHLLASIVYDYLFLIFFEKDRNLRDACWDPSQMAYFILFYSFNIIIILPPTCTHNYDYYYYFYFYYFLEKDRNLN
jgi:hypothetical protein